MYKKEFEIRWSDVDANAHLGNTAYINFMSHTRVSFFTDHGLIVQDMLKLDIGPILFYEHINYFKEAFLGENITVTAELLGLSDNGMLFQFEHNLYNNNGNHIATSDTFGAWINTETRKLIALPFKHRNKIHKAEKSARFKILTKSNLTKDRKLPIDL